MKKFIILLFLLHGFCAAAQPECDSVRIYFRQGHSVLEPDLYGNRESLKRIEESLQPGDAGPNGRLRRIEVVGGASPEGSVALNRRLSEKRAKALLDHLSHAGGIPDSLLSFTFLGRNWIGLLRLVENDPNVPDRDAALELLHDIAERCHDGEKTSDGNIARLMRFKDGEPYRYMYRKLFPELRASQLYLWYEITPARRQPIAAEIPVAKLTMRESALAPVPVPAPAGQTPGRRKPLYMALKTNLLYDALAVPNIGIEFYAGRNWSVGGNWMYAWWKTDRRHWYWRTYGGELNIRKWFGKKAQEKPLQGHHLGLYGQIVTYDFETGGRGYMGGKPGGSLWDKANWGAGIEYGYSLPVARRLNVDFTLGVGYLGGEYWEYTALEDCYVWQATKQRRWFGPTKAEVSLVWLLGAENRNAKKGGRR
ncbi:DUF3575 domain-containing protein [uncultured Alistipes sp.]|jgi:hypothetical protein|uniref:DUF3575 domain-containing protein n=1 Tax=uncultured Alistipes sp. TaxID=538949 RepID=UPI0025F463E1|nr:DUF3575 domain-containing protein [uncultured Alistipes sp.]